MRRFKLILAVFFIYFFSQPVLSQFYNKKYAVVVGINDYLNKQLDLTYAKGDAMAVESMLKELGFTVFSLYDNQATKVNIISMLEDELDDKG